MIVTWEWWLCSVGLSFMAQELQISQLGQMLLEMFYCVLYLIVKVSWKQGEESHHDTLLSEYNMWYWGLLGMMGTQENPDTCRGCSELCRNKTPIVLPLLFSFFFFSLLELFHRGFCCSIQLFLWCWDSIMGRVWCREQLWALEGKNLESLRGRIPTLLWGQSSGAFAGWGGWRREWTTARDDNNPGLSSGPRVPSFLQHSLPTYH